MSENSVEFQATGNFPGIDQARESQPQDLQTSNPLLMRSPVNIPLLDLTKAMPLIDPNSIVYTIAEPKEIDEGSFNQASVTLESSHSTINTSEIFMPSKPEATAKQPNTSEHMKDISKIMTIDDTISRDESTDIQVLHNLPSRYSQNEDMKVLDSAVASDFTVTNRTSDMNNPSIKKLIASKADAFIGENANYKEEFVRNFSVASIKAEMESIKRNKQNFEQTFQKIMTQL